jgi:cyclohexyl-isocyanide hydratase
VCTGALVLGAAGLLRGYRATTHWLSLELLAELGATPVEARVVRDRNRITGGGVTAGIDFALTLVSELRGRDVAERIAVILEYALAPPSARPSAAGVSRLPEQASRRPQSPKSRCQTPRHSDQVPDTSFRPPRGD